MEWVYLSPHYDDAALSCGGLIWEQGRAGARTWVWTICAGDPPQGPLSPFAEALHARWETGTAAVARRRRENSVSCARMGAVPLDFSLPDCIYRRAPGGGPALYDSEESLWGEVDYREIGRVDDLSSEFARSLPEGAGWVCPLALGGHVDHRLTRMAAERLGRPLWYYPDYPYALQGGSALDELREAGWRTQVFPVSPEGLEAWIGAAAAHTSQLSTFWTGVDDMRDALATYSASQGGVRLWQPPG